MDHRQHCDALGVEVERFATALERTDFDLVVPSCPDWSVHNLAEHLGHVHRWAEHLVRVLAPQRISSDDMGFERGPVDVPWLRRGGEQLLATLRRSDPDAAMWAWGLDQHVRFWSRRQLHETMVHRVDLELTAGTDPYVEPAVASDAIDEFLVNLERAHYFSPKVRELHGHGETLRFSSLDVSGDWTIELYDEGFRLVDGAASPNVTLAGSASDVLFVLYRRRPLGEGALKVEGDRDLLDFWLTSSALE